MTIRVKRRWIFLGLMLCVTLAAAAWMGRGENTNDEEIAAPKNSNPIAKAGFKKQENEKLPQLEFDKLKRSAMDKVKQSLFVAKSWYVPPPPVNAQAPATPTAPPLPFAYMGKLQEDSGRLIIYLAKGEQTYSVSRGDVIDDTYRIDAIENGQVVMTYLPLTVKQTLPIGGGL
jgi:hypothetical protein